MHLKWFLRFLLLGAGVGTGLALRANARQRRTIQPEGKVVLITGGSRGLGLAIAEEFARQGARLAICARQIGPLESAKQKLTALGAEVVALSCDVRDQEQTDVLVEQVISQFGRIDILVNNAGIITVGPQETMTIEDYDDSMNTIFWGTVYPTLAVLPFMREQRGGRIVNITSIGGRVSVPHLLPYSSAKFATLGFSEGLHQELVKEEIYVTSVVPGLMRTGSHINAFVKGQRQIEYTMFGLAATLPFTSTSAANAARQIVQSACRGDTELVLTPQAQILGRFHGLLPGLTTDILTLVTRVLPRAGTQNMQGKTGLQSRSASGAWLTAGGEAAAREYNQYARQDE